MVKIHNNYITIAKAIGIILMVMGHSHCPYYMEKFIYSFHMPFFFISSGYFFIAVLDLKGLFFFFQRKLRGLYLPFIKWCVTFIVLHNFFYKLGFYSYLYSSRGDDNRWFYFKDFVIKIISNITTMESIPELLGGFWFLKDLFLGSLFVAIITFILRKSKVCIKYVLLPILFLGAFIANFMPKELQIIRDVLWSSTFFYTGYVLRYISFATWHKLACIVIFIGINLLPYKLEFPSGGRLMPLTFLTSFSGSILVLEISKKIENFPSVISRFLYYVGNHTLVILGLHFLCFKLVNLLIIWYYQLPIDRLASFPNIKGYPYTWIIYTVVGVVMPLVMYKLYESTLGRVSKVLYKKD